MNVNNLFRVIGGNPLVGAISVSGNKNSVFPLVGAALLGDEIVRIGRVPKILDVISLQKVVESIGGKCDLAGGTLTVSGSGINKYELPPEASDIRAAILLVPSLLKRFGKAHMPYPGGDKIGSRPLTVHFRVLEEMGVCVVESESGFEFSLDKTVDMHTWLRLDEPSVTGTELALLMISALSSGTVIYNAACEPHVQSLCNYLNSCGMKIEGVGSNLLSISRRASFQAFEFFELDHDFMEVGSIIAAVGACGGEVIIGEIDHTSHYITKRLFSQFGIDIKSSGDGKHLLAKCDREKLIKGHHINIKPGPWPSLNPDLVSPAIVTAALVPDQLTLVHDHMFDKRLNWAQSQLCDFGAKTELLNAHQLRVRGVPKFIAPGQKIETPDIRAGMALLIAAMTAEGETLLTSMQIERGYEAIDLRLRRLGVQIEKANWSVG